ncbi:MAG: hypothetical protein ACKV2T_42675 [Kofleriaceae bacterium]
MMILLPLISLAVPPTPPAIETSSPRGAQARLAELIGSADAVHSISVRRSTEPSTSSGKAKPASTIAFEVALDRDATTYRITATVNARGEVIGIALDEGGSSFGDVGSLSWLSPAIANANAITRIAVDEDDAVTLTTDAGDAFMIIPGRGSGGAGNEAASARWAAAWDSPEA